MYMKNHLILLYAFYVSFEFLFFMYIKYSVIIFCISLFFSILCAPNKYSICEVYK